MLDHDLDIRELRPHDLERVVAMAGANSEPVDATHVVHARSLVMFRGETPVAAALFEQCGGRGRLVVCAPDDSQTDGADGDDEQTPGAEDDTRESTEGATEDPPSTSSAAGIPRQAVALLIDKALMKLHAAGVRRFAIDLEQCGGQDALQSADFLRGIARDRAA